VDLRWKRLNVEPQSIRQNELAAALQPIRFLVLAHVLHSCMESGIMHELKASPKSVQSLASVLKLDERRLQSLIEYLANEKYVEKRPDQTVALTDAAKSLANFEPWYTLLVGGYGKTFSELSNALRDHDYYASRDGASVGKGSCGISQHDALPMTRKLLQWTSGKVRTVVDIGCGDASFLIELCKSITEIQGVGFDPVPQSVELGRQRVIEAGMSSRVRVEEGSALHLPPLEAEQVEPCFLTAFVLQELLEQSGRPSIISMLREAFERYPNAYWIVIEVDHRPADADIMRDDLGLAYYNPYYLIHAITEQRLARVSYWKELFNEAGLAVVAIEYPDPAYDSLALKVGFLLSAKSADGGVPR